MTKEDLNLILDNIIPKLYKFSVVVAADQLLAEQNIVDALTVFMMENKEFLQDQDIDINNKKEKRSFSKYLLKELLFEIYFLNEKRAMITQGISAGLTPEYEEFNQLGLQQRVVLYLKEVEGFSVPDLMELLSLKYHEVIQIFYNAKNKLLKNSNEDFELDNLMEQMSHSRNMHLINSLVYETYKPEYKERIEQILDYGQDMQEYFQFKQNERDFFKQLIPEIVLKKSDLSQVRREMLSVLTDIMPVSDLSIFERVKKVLNKPVVRIDY